MDYGLQTDNMPRTGSATVGLTIESLARLRPVMLPSKRVNLVATFTTGRSTGIGVFVALQTVTTLT